MKVRKKEITEVVKSFEDAVVVTGRPSVLDLSNVPKDMRGNFENQYQMIVIAEALNEGWSADWSNYNQCKWLPIFYKHEGLASSGFVFRYADYYCSLAYAGYGSRLCFKSEELATYAGKQFLEIWNKILEK